MEAKKDKLSKIRSALDRIIEAEQSLCCYILIIEVAITFVQVVLRSFNNPFSWSEEVTLMFLVWFGYLCIPIDIYTDSHAALFFAYGKLPPFAKKFLDLGRHGILVWFSVLMIKYGAKITALNIAKKQPATQLSQGLLFAPLVIGGILMTVYAAFNFASTCLKPLSEYVVDKNAVKTIDELNRERGGN